MFGVFFFLPEIEVAGSYVFHPISVFKAAFKAANVCHLICVVQLNSSFSGMERRPQLTRPSDEELAGYRRHAQLDRTVIKVILMVNVPHCSIVNGKWHLLGAAEEGHSIHCMVYLSCQELNKKPSVISKETQHKGCTPGLGLNILLCSM